MSISQALNNALSGLTASARMAEVVSSNLANVNTDGYGRRVLDLSAQTIGGEGAGVAIDGVRRIVDRGVIADRRLAESALSGHEQSAASLTRLEQIVGTVGDGTNLSDRIAAVESALVAAGSDPASGSRLTLVTTRLSELTGALKERSDGIQGLRQEAEQSIVDQVDTLNTSLGRLEELNGDITRLVNTNGDPSALMDERQRIVDKIATIVPVREMDRGRGQIALMTTSGQMLLDGKAATVAFEPHHTITADMTFASGSLNGLTLNGDPLSATDGVGRLNGGSLGAAFALRDRTLVDVQAGLDTVAADLIARFEDPAVDPTLAPGDPGLLTDGGGPLDPADLPGLAGRIRVNAAVDPAQGGEAWRIRDGLNAATSGTVGDAAQIARWQGALSAVRPDPGGGAAASAAGLAGRFTSVVGGTRVAADEQLSYANARWSGLKEAELANGVDSDHEMQMLVRIEQAYAANAKLIQTVQSMMQALMEI